MNNLYNVLLSLSSIYYYSEVVDRNATFSQIYTELVEVAIVGAQVAVSISK